MEPKTNPAKPRKWRKTSASERKSVVDWADSSLVVVHAAESRTRVELAYEFLEALV